MGVVVGVPFEMEGEQVRDHEVAVPGVLGQRALVAVVLELAAQEAVVLDVVGAGERPPGREVVQQQERQVFPWLTIETRLYRFLLKHGGDGYHAAEQAGVGLDHPGEAAAFTGYFYGAAGYGTVLLRMHDALRETTPGSVQAKIALPDDPFGL